MSEIKRKRKSGNDKEKTSSAKDSNRKIKFSPVPKSKHGNKNNSELISKFSLEEVIEKFDDLFLNEDKFSEKRVKEFSKEFFFHQERNRNDSRKLNYNNLFIVILKFSGLEMQQTRELQNLIQKVDEDNFADFELIEDIIAQTKVKNEKFKTSKVYQIFESLIAEIYNNYDVTNEADFLILKKFILNCLKLTQNKYRKIRYYSTLILLNIFKLSFEEFIVTKKILNQKSKQKKNSTRKTNLDSFVKSGNTEISLEENTTKLLTSKFKILEEICQILKEKFIFKKISDVSKNIRLTICDYVVKISKNHFNELFSDTKLIKFYPFFLIDSSNNIKSKYLQLMYEKLDLLEEENDASDDDEEEQEDAGEASKNSNFDRKSSQTSTLNTIIDILLIAKDAILNICVKEDKLIAKQAIKIIELLSQHNILENKTVQALLPHLFNPEVQIRNLISKVVVNYILNFERVKIVSNEEEQEADEELYNSQNNFQKTNSKNKNSENSNTNLSYTLPTIENLIEMLQFFYKLADNEEKMIKVLVDNFYDQLNIFKHFNLFFDLIYYILYNANINNNNNKLEIKCNYDTLLQTCLIILNYSIEKNQLSIEKLEMEKVYLNDKNNKNESNSQAIKAASGDLEANKILIAKNEEFINLLLNNSTSLIKKMRINLDSPTKCENFTYFLNLFDKFKIYSQNLIKFDLPIISELAKELKNSFFTNVNFLENTDSAGMNENIFESLNEMLLKSLHKIIIYSNDKFNRSQSLDEIIYSEKSSSLAKDYCDMLFNVIIKSEIYKQLSNIPVDEYEANFNLNLNNKFSKHAINFDQNQMTNFYMLISQFNYLLIYFKDIFNFLTENNTSDKLNFQNFSNFLQNLIRFVLEKCDKSDLISQNLIYKISEASLKLIETIHIVLFNNILSHSVQDWKEVDSYLNYRNRIFFTISYLLTDVKFAQDLNNLNVENSSSNLMKAFNNQIFKIKTLAVNLLLEMLIYISSERIQNLQLKFVIDEKLTDMIENFVKMNFIKFYLDYNKYLKEKQSMQNPDDQNQNAFVSQSNNLSAQNFVNSSWMENSIFLEELSLKTFCLKLLNEKFSRLLILNLGIFKYTNFCCVYFETFFMIKLPVIIENLNSYVYENLLEKEVSHFVKNIQEGINNQNNFNIMIFYLTKITMRIFTNKSKLFYSELESDSNFTQDEKIDMIKRFANYYFKGMKKMKMKYSKENVEISKKDKLFYENFVINSINYALESRKEIFEEEPNDIENLEAHQEEMSGLNPKKILRIDIENVKFFDLIKFYLKNSIFFNDNDLKNILMIFIKLSKNVQLLENVNRSHIKIIEKFKNFLLNKAKVFISENENKEERKYDQDVEMNEEEEEDHHTPVKKVKKNKKNDESNFEKRDDSDKDSDSETEKKKNTKEIEKKKKIKEKVQEEKKEKKKRKFKDLEEIDKNKLSKDEKLVNYNQKSGKKMKKK